MSETDDGTRTSWTFERTVTVPADAAQVWTAVATGDGCAAWMGLPVQIEERAGGAVAFTLMPDMVSRGRVTVWEPTARFGYDEDDWAAMAGHPEASLGAVSSVFDLDPLPGGGCAVRVRTTATGTGAPWEAEFWQEMTREWGQLVDRIPAHVAVPAR